MLLLGWVLFSGLLLTIVAKNAVAKHEAANRWSQPGYSDLLAEHEACVTEAVSYTHLTLPTTARV